MGYIGSGPTRFNTADELTVTGDAELKGNTTIDGNLTVAGTTTSIDSASVQTVDLGDNDKIRLGDGNDLQIYWDGSTGQISSGFNVTGSVTTDGLTVSGNVSVDGGTIKLDGNYPVGTQNVALGDAALSSGSLTGNYNVAIGALAGDAITTGSQNVAVGRIALSTNTTGEFNTAVGASALQDNTGSNNTAVGKSALEASGSASNNTAVGYNSLAANTTGTQNVAVGANALDANTTADEHTAVGYNALTTNTTGARNTAIGNNALNSNTTGTDNTAVGRYTLFSNTSADNNTAIGRSALQNNTAGNNTAMGKSALLANTTGDGNVAIGRETGEANTTGAVNTFIGDKAGESNTTGSSNTYIGRTAGQLCTTGGKNTILGRYDGNQGGLDIRTSSNNIVLSDGDGNPRVRIDNNGTVKASNSVSNCDRYSAVGHVLHSDTASNVSAFIENSSSVPFGLFIDYSTAAPDTNNNYFVKCQDNTSDRLIIWSDGDVVNHDNSYGSLSDVKLKEQITDASSQWGDIKALNIRKYKMKSDVADKGDSDEHWRLGVIAQEVEEAGMSGLIKTNPDIIENENGELVESGEYTKTVKYSILYMKAVKALQEAMDRIETLEAKVATLEGN